IWLIAAVLQAPLTTSTPGITRSVIVDRGGFQAVRVEYTPTASEGPAPNVYDEVIVPIDAGMSIQGDGKSAAWRPGVGILIPRGAPHLVRNASTTTVAFISVRRLGDAVIKPPPPPATNDATVVRSEDSKYVRATTVRVERGGEVRSPAATDAGPSLFILAGD